jgi:hypothetical protein
VEDEQAPKQLIVEGQDDRQAVVELMRKHVVGWPQIGKKGAPVIIRLGNSVDEILSEKYLQGTLKTAPLKVLGVMLDADGGVTAEDRYASFRNQCNSLFPGLPRHLPKDGLIDDNGEKRLGLWVMPDNSSDGGLETWLQHFVPESAKQLWDYAESCCTEGRKVGASYRDAHIHKARMYSFLAWQDPPGQSPGNAISRGVLDPQSSNARQFLAWFRQLFSI